MQFENVFCELIKSVSDCKPYLCLPFYYFRYKLEQMYNNQEIKLENIEDLERALENLGYLKFDDYRKSKDSYLKSLEFKNYKVERKKTGVKKCVTFSHPINTIFLLQ